MIEPQNQERQEQTETDEKIKSLILFVKIISFFIQLPCDIIIFIIQIWSRTQKFSIFIKALFQEIKTFSKRAYNYIIDFLISAVAYELLYVILEEANKTNSEIIHKFKVLLRFLRISENALNNNRLIRQIRSNIRRDR